MMLTRTCVCRYSLIQSSPRSLSSLFPPLTAHFPPRSAASAMYNEQKDNSSAVQGLDHDEANETLKLKSHDGVIYGA
jgi:hypothetical protein